MELPHTRENIKLIDKNSNLRVSGKALNHYPSLLLENDIFIMNKFKQYADDVEGLNGTNDNGVIDHIHTYKENENMFIKLYDEKIKLFGEFLEENKAIQKINEFIPCHKFTKECPADKMVLAQYDNIRLDYIGDTLNTVCCPVIDPDKNCCE